MNFWTGLILGIIIGWLVEWIIDWLFWRRDAEDAREQERLMEERLAAANATSANLNAEWEVRLSSAEQEYQTRLRAVEGEWQSRLNLNEQQWQSQFAALEEDNRDLRSRLADLTAGATIAAAGAVVVDKISSDDSLQGDLDRIEGINDDLIERMHLAGIYTVDELANADPTTLSIALGLDRAETEYWIRRAAELTSAAGVVAVGAQKAAPPFRDDLTLIHGIGPRYADLLAAAGIISFDDLAEATPVQLRDIIKPGILQQVNFDSWIAQAAAFVATRSARAGDDLTELEGIGPVYAAKLRERGITTFGELASTDEATLAGIIDAPAWRRVNYGDWIAQARLAADGDEAGLRELQDRLFRRGGDNLSLIHGIGRRSADALQAAGITTYAALAAATPEELDGIVRGAGVRGGFDYEAWINEAGVRASGKRVPSTRARPTHIVPCPQDLSAVPGVGPVIEERLYAAGIGSYWGLAETPIDELSAILDARSIPGVDLEAIKAAAMQLAVEGNSLGRAWDGTPPDDFDVLTGIGEVYERRLYEAGICTYATLAATSAERLAEICKAPPMRTPNYAAWIATAAELSAAERSS